jgi:arginine/ornithine N-succinyltransferase beta subunit
LAAGIKPPQLQFEISPVVSTSYDLAFEQQIKVLFFS